ncbi:MAG: ADP-ribosylglycohydrolase family protein [Anaerovoracaceae bacterium]
MLGAIIGDIVGSIYEFDNIKTKDFELFDKGCFFTDDTVMSVAVAEALLDTKPVDKENVIKNKLAASMKKWGREYPYAGYGGRFAGWLASDNTAPYNSYGNGSAMRVAAAGWLYDDMFTTRYMARLTSDVTHNHIEGIKGAEAAAAAIFLARNGASKQEIREYIEKEFGYDLNFTCDEIRPTYYFNETCMDTVPQAIVAFLDGESFEDVIRTGVSIGGDTDTLCAIAGSIAEAYYGIPDDIGGTAKSFLTEDLLEVVDKFYREL